MGSGPNYFWLLEVDLIRNNLKSTEHVNITVGQSLLANAKTLKVDSSKPVKATCLIMM
jgi:hypothetical protein